MQSTQPVDVPTPRTDKASDFTAPEKLYRCSQQLERELIAATAELKHAKEQLRVALRTSSGKRMMFRGWDRISAALDTDEMDDIRESHAFRILRSLFVRLNTFTQPQSGAVDPVKGEEG